MITKSVYQVLRPFRDGPVHREEGPDDVIRDLCGREFIKPTKSGYLGGLSIIDVEWEITRPGRLALEEYEAQRHAARMGLIWSYVLGVLSGITCTLLAQWLGG